QPYIPIDVAHEEDGTIDQDEVVRGSVILVREDLSPRYADQLDRHALCAAVAVLGLRSIRKTHERIVGSGLGEQPDLVFRRNVGENLELGSHATVLLGMLAA